MTVLRFPNGKKALTPTITNITTPGERLSIGPLTFTCVNCRTKNEFQTQGMIFRQLEFYCSCCGYFYRVANPAFGKK